MATPLILRRTLVDEREQTPQKYIARIPGIPVRGLGDDAERAVEELQRQLRVFIGREGLGRAQNMVTDSLSVTHALPWDLSDLVSDSMSPAPAHAGAESESD
jgi:hypothetical protein